jgi:hypothetical protein
MSLGLEQPCEWSCGIVSDMVWLHAHVHTAGRCTMLYTASQSAGLRYMSAVSSSAVK